jgi:hypothetical protein
MLLVSDPEMVKEIFIKEFSNFTNRPVSISTLGVIKLWNIGSAERYIYSICMCCINTINRSVYIANILLVPYNIVS